MRNFSKFIPITFVWALVLFLAPPVHSQTQSTTRVIPNPDGGIYYVDGQIYEHATSFIWPQGSKHTLSAPITSLPGFNVQYAFQSWEWSGGQLPGNTVVVTADPAITQYTVNFSLNFGVNLVFYNCAAGSGTCQPPGTVFLNGVALTNDLLSYFPAGSSVTAIAQPNPGYVFVGWTAGTSQVITGFQDVVTVNSPVTIQPIFKPARPINFATVPAGLSLLADRTLIPTPDEIDWGMGTTHTIAAISPQGDATGNHWVFSSWSDGGALSHAYTVSNASVPDTLTATFIPGVAVNLQTIPGGLSLNIDGRTNWPGYAFTWGVGEAHSISAPATQTDSAGHVWQFSGWSDGGAATHNYTVPSDSTSISMGVRVTATYTPMGHAVITSSLSGLSVTVDGTACQVPCDIVRSEGSQAVVVAPASIPVSANTRQDFAGWSNGVIGALTLNFATNDTVTVGANYNTMNYLATGSSPSGSVSFALQPASPDGYYNAQASVSVTATALPGYRFRNWSGDLSGSSPSGTVSMSSPRAVQALMDKVPFVAPAGVVNGAGTTPVNGVAPGSVVSIFGANLASDVFSGQSSPMPQTLGGVTVHIADRLLPLFFASPTQINVQVPTDLSPSQQTLTVSSTGQPDVQAQFNMVQDAPGIFPQSINGQTFALALHADGSTITPSSPAAQGETITIYGTGFGGTTPARPAGLAVPSSPVYVLNDPASVQLNGVPLQVTSAFALAGSVGVDAIQVLVSGDGLPTATNAQLTITVNGQTSNTILLPMQ